jgi:hypothetical protein
VATLTALVLVALAVMPASSVATVGDLLDRILSLGTPLTGVAVYDSVGSANVGQEWKVWGGNSAAAPVVAGFYALLGSGAGVGGASWDYAHPTYWDDVLTGSNGSCGAPLCSAGPGWDGPTGLGTPDGSGRGGPHAPTSALIRRTSDRAAPPSPLPRALSLRLASGDRSASVQISCGGLARRAGTLSVTAAARAARSTPPMVLGTARYSLLPRARQTVSVALIPSRIRFFHQAVPRVQFSAEPSSIAPGA